MKHASQEVPASGNNPVDLIDERITAQRLLILDAEENIAKSRREGLSSETSEQALLVATLNLESLLKTKERMRKHLPDIDE